MYEKSSDRRRSRRVALKLRGRYMLSDGYESHCETLDISTTGVRIHADVLADIGERVIAYIDDLGRIEGDTVRRGDDWFVMEIRITRGRIDRIAQKLRELSGVSLETTMVAPILTEKRTAKLQLAFGQVYALEVSDETSFGAKVHADFRLLHGAKLTIDGRPAIVVGDEPDGFLVEYSRRPL